MNRMKRSFLVAAVATFSACLAVPADSLAQAFPIRLVTIVVPFPVGSTGDAVARKLADYMRAKTGGTVIVENKVGADGNIAAQFVLRAPADGHTLFLTGNSVHGANASLFKELPFDPIGDFDFIGGIMALPMVLSVRADFPANSVTELLAEAKKRQKPLFFATGNNSTRGASELFKLKSGLQAEHVPYRGSPQVLADLIGGQFDFAFLDTNTVVPAIKDGRVKALAVSTEKRTAALPNVPALAEYFSGYSFVAWAGLATRSKTPPETLAKLTSLVHDFSIDPATVSYLATFGSTPMPLSGKELKSSVEADTRTWAEIVKAANIEKK